MKTGVRTAGRPAATTVVIAALTLLLACAGVGLPRSASAAPTLLSQGRPATASSSENGGTPASAAVDGDTGTRWSSAAADPQWLQVDLGGPVTVSQVVLNWETAYATALQIQTSDDAASWRTVYSTTTGTGGTQTLNVSGAGRYVRMNGTARATQWGYSLWEVQVFGTSGSAPPPGGTPISAYKQVSASSTEGGNAPAAALDGRTNTRWSSLATDNEWLQVDLGGAAWNSGPGAAHYEVWLNVSRTDYDFTASGRLLDLYTKVAEPTGTSYTPTWDIADRWTYKWYVVSVSGSGAKTTSNIRTFSVYRPDVRAAGDGVNIVNGARDLNKDGTIQPYEDWRQPVETRVADLLGRMTAEEKAD